MRPITLLDGAVGTSLWKIAEQHGEKKVPVWRYNIEHPEYVTELHDGFIAAGSRIILANTFGANGPTVKRSGIYNAPDIIKAGVALAKKSAAGHDVKVALAAGPLSELMEPYGDLTEEEVAAIYEEQIGTGIDAGADCVMIQTFIDLEMMKVAARVAKQYSVPVYCTMSFEAKGRTMFGNSVEDVIEGLAPLGIDGIGLNCSLGPTLALPVIREFAEKTDLPLVFKPNAGKPIIGSDGSTISDYTAQNFAEEIAPALEFVSFIGGCCGSDAEYVREIAKKL